MLRVVGDASVNAKSSVPTSSKLVGDINGSAETTYTYGTTADHDIGDDVPFILSATVPSTFGDYSTYKMVFHDTLSTYLDLNESSITVTIMDTNGSTSVEIPATTTVSNDPHTNYTVISTGLTDGCTFEIIFEDLNKLYDVNGSKITVAAGYTIQVDYTAELLTNAAFKNTNTMHLEYSNNPYDTTSTGTTPDDIVTVFTYTLELTKTANTTSTSLLGATFALYKFDLSKGTAGEYVLVDTIDGTSTNIFTFSGLDDGQYKLVEVVTPAGFNTMDDLYFKITATHTEDSNGEAKVTSLSVIQTDSAGEGVTTATQTFNISTDYSTISATIVNKSGSSLPLTGGIGTTIFYIVGAVLVCGAAVLLITKRRMRRS